MRQLYLFSGIVLLLMLLFNIPTFAGCLGDCNDNGTVDGSDIAILASEFGTTNCNSKSPTLENVIQEGTVKVGVLLWDCFGFFEGQTYSGFEADLARALAAAIFGDKNKVTFVRIPVANRFTDLQNGEFDVLFRISTFTLSRDTELNLNFAPVYFHDGQSIMTRTEWTLHNLNGKSIGVLEDSSHQDNLTRFMDDQQLTYTEVKYADLEEMFAAYENGEIDAVSSDISILNAYRSNFQNFALHCIFPQLFSKEPLSPVVRHGDDLWYDIIKWTIYALIRAEELGITSSNVDSFLTTDDPEITLFLGLEGSLGQKLGLSDDWAYKMIKQVGNFGEIFDRNFGPLTPTHLPRDQNNLFKNEGLLYAPPFR